MNEKDVHDHVPEERAHLFSSTNPSGAEDEYQELLAALVRTTKPERILETGTYHGVTTVALAQACEKNNLGKVWTLENNPDCIAVARKALSDAWLEDRVELVQADTLSWLNATKMTFDFAFLDSQLCIRAVELRMLIENRLMPKNSFVAIHDTSRLRVDGNDKSQRDPESIQFWRGIDSMRDEGLIVNSVEFPLSRGLLLVQVV